MRTLTFPNPGQTRSRLHRLHRTSGVVMSVFALMHIVIHLSSLLGIGFYTRSLEAVRMIYRNPLAETLLIGAVLVQIVSGIGLAWRTRREARPCWEKLRVYSGLYLAFFLIAHTGAIFIYRHIVHLETGFYFASLGFNISPATYVFVPYYLLGVYSVFVHLACTHYFKVQPYTTVRRARAQAMGILGLGLAVCFLILYGYTGGFAGVHFPKEYLDLTR